MQPFNGLVFHDVAEKVWLACLLGLLACTETGHPVVTHVDPRWIIQGEETTVTVRGSHFFDSAAVNLDDRSPAVLNDASHVRVGDLSIPDENVHRIDAQTLTVVVPGTLELGTHDLVLTTPAGVRATLSPGLTVVEGDGETSTLDDVRTSEATPTSSSAMSETLVATTSGSESDSVDPNESSAGGLDAGVSDLETLRGALTHRYSFDRAGTTVVDSVGGANGTFIGGSLDGVSGNATFSGRGEYIDLPNALIAGYEAVTIEVWLIWDAPDQGPAHSWQRVFDFGSNNAAEGLQGTSQDTHLFLTPRSGGPAGSLLLGYRGNLTGSVTLQSQLRVPPRVLQHVAALVDGTNRQMALYVDGTLSASRDLEFPLSSIDFRNVWLGRSQLDDDPAFQGRIFELRVYDRALDGNGVQASYAAGPDAML